MIWILDLLHDVGDSPSLLPFPRGGVHVRNVKMLWRHSFLTTYIRLSTNQIELRLRVKQNVRQNEDSSLPQNLNALGTGTNWKKKNDMLHAWSCFRKLWTAVKNYSWSFRLIFRSNGFGGKSEKSVQALITTKHPPEGRGGDTWSMINDQVDRMGRGDKMWMKLMVWAFLGVTTISCRHFRFHLL